MKVTGDVPTTVGGVERGVGSQLVKKTANMGVIRCGPCQNETKLCRIADIFQFYVKKSNCYTLLLKDLQTPEINAKRAKCLIL